MQSRLVKDDDVDHRSGFCSSNGVFYSKRRPVEIPENVDLVSFVFAGRRGSDEVALIDGVTGRSLSYDELEQTIGALGTGLSKVVGVQQHDVVAQLLSNSIEFPVCFLAVTWLGAVVTTLNPANTSQELRKQISSAGAKYVITSADMLEKVEGAQLPTVILGSMENVPQHSSHTIYSYSDLLTAGLPNVSRPQSKQSDTVSILFSSGTTGRSKGVALTHRSYIAAVCGQLACDSGEHLTRMLTVLPMYQSYGISVCVLSPLARGISLVVLKKFEVVTLLNAIQKYRVTHMCSVPPIVKALIHHQDVQNLDLKSWVQLACGAAPLVTDTIAAFVKKFPSVKFKQEYGMTETAGCMASLEAGDGDHADSSGTLLPRWEAMVIDLATTQPLSFRKTGELWVRGPSVMKEYINDTRATEETIDKNGWLRTGDVVKFDEDGYLYIVDRLKELIKYNGYQVAPAELEELLSSHPAVLDCAVIPYPDKQSGQIPMACIVQREGSKITADDIMHWVAKQVAPYKKVRKVAFMDTIPKTATGKILHKELVKLVTLKSKL